MEADLRAGATPSWPASFSAGRGASAARAPARPADAALIARAARPMRSRPTGRARRARRAAGDRAGARAARARTGDPRQEPDAGPSSTQRRTCARRRLAFRRLRPRSSAARRTSRGCAPTCSAVRRPADDARRARRSRQDPARAGARARGCVEDFRDGAYFVALGPSAASKTWPPPSCASSTSRCCRRSRPSGGWLATWAIASMLLVLDNFEHVLDAAPLVADLLAAASRLRALVTSREPLRLRAERLFRLEPLALPPARPTATGRECSGAGRCPVPRGRARTESRASRSARTTPRRSRACAAAWTGCRSRSSWRRPRRTALGRRARGPPARRPGRARDGAARCPARQRTLTATLEWSYALLTRMSSAALAGLAVFAGGCTVEAAQAVTGASLDVLEALVSEEPRRCRRPSWTGPVRLLLLETVADFARDRLAERRDAGRLRERHVDCYLALAERRSRSSALGSARAGRRARPRAPQLRAALDLGVERPRARPRAQAGDGTFTPYWGRQGLDVEASRWLGPALGGRVPCPRSCAPPRSISTPTASPTRAPTRGRRRPPGRASSSDARSATPQAAPKASARRRSEGDAQRAPGQGGLPLRERRGVRARDRERTGARRRAASPGGTGAHARAEPGGRRAGRRPPIAPRATDGSLQRCGRF